MSSLSPSCHFWWLIDQYFFSFMTFIFILIFKGYCQFIYFFILLFIPCISYCLFYFHIFIQVAKLCTLLVRCPVGKRNKYASNLCQCQVPQMVNEWQEMILYCKPGQMELLVCCKWQNHFHNYTSKHLLSLLSWASFDIACWAPLHWPAPPQALGLPSGPKRLWYKQYQFGTAWLINWANIT